MNKIKLLPEAENIIKKLCENGFSAYAVGGCVRDCIIGREPCDWDVATSALPEDVKRIFRHTADTGIRHGTITVIENGECIEVTTFRTEEGYSDFRRPDKVCFVSDILKDLSRRDFTVNAIAYNHKDGIIDPFGGIDDINKGIIRAVGKATKRFLEDALRILRAIRFSATLGFKIEEQTKNACKECADGLYKISAERVFTELNKTFKYANEYHYGILEETGILKAVLPFSIKYDVYAGWERLVKCSSDEMRWAHLYKENVSDVLARMKTSRVFRLKAKEIAAFYAVEIKNIKKAASLLKYASFDEVCEFLDDDILLTEFNKIKKGGEPIYPNDIRISSEALMKAGFFGKDIGIIKKKLLEYLWDNPGDNNEEKLLEIASNMRGDLK